MNIIGDIMIEELRMLNIKDMILIFNIKRDAIYNWLEKNNFQKL